MQEQNLVTDAVDFRLIRSISSINFLSKLENNTVLSSACK